MQYSVGYETAYEFFLVLCVVCMVGGWVAQSDKRLNHPQFREQPISQEVLCHQTADDCRDLQCIFATT